MKNFLDYTDEEIKIMYEQKHELFEQEKLTWVTWAYLAWINAWKWVESRERYINKPEVQNFLHMYQQELIKAVEDVQEKEYKKRNFDLKKNRSALINKINELKAKKTSKEKQRNKDGEVSGGIIEYSSIKLSDASWMTELPNKLDVYDIFEYLEQIQKIWNIWGEDWVQNKIEFIIDSMEELWLYTQWKDYRLWLTLLSNGYLSLFVTHDKVKGDKWAGYHFYISDDIDKVLLLLQKLWYSDKNDNHIDSCMWPIVNTEDNNEDEDENGDLAY